MSYSVRKRVLTRKSILGFGYADERDLSVQTMLDTYRHKRLVSAYFGLSKIDFTPDILDELGIPESMRIEKPCRRLTGEKLSESISVVMNLRYEKLSDIERKKAKSYTQKSQAVRERNYHKSRNKRDNSMDYLRLKNQGK